MSAPAEPTSSTEAKLSLNAQLIRKTAVILRAINHPLRQQMLQIIFSKQKITVTELYIALRLEQSVASQHLAILRRAGFVKTHRDGKFIQYSVNEKKMESLEQLIGAFLSS
jgi:DNA-binding transcriptional ArsR family regulator